MAKKISAVIALLLITVLLSISFTNTTSLQRPQTFSSVVFGPSIRAEDGRTIFNYRERHAMWSNLRTKTDAIMLETLFLDNAGDFVNPTHSEQVALTDSQIQELKLIQSNLTFKVQVTTGIALGKFCHIRDPILMARTAVDLELRLLSRLINKPIDQRVIIDTINVDGPFLRVLNLSRKDLSCNTNQPPRGFNNTDAAEIVAHYLSFLKNDVERIQGSPVKINLLINLPNWRYDQFMEIAWGEHKNQAINLREILDLLKNNPSTPLINEVVLDYPYQFVARHTHRKITTGNSAGESICGAGVSCRLITPTEAFEGKISLLSNQLRNFRGSPKISFITNTADTGINACIQYGQQPPYLLPYQNNKCLDTSYPLAREKRTNALLLQDRLDSEYIVDVFRYYNLVKYRLPADVRVGSLYMQSWHANPRLMSSFAAHVTEILDD